MTVEQAVRQGRQLSGRTFHGASIQRSAVLLRDTQLPLEAVNASFSHIYRQISQFFEENQQALVNFRRSRGNQQDPLRIVSDVGYNEILRPRGGVPFTFYIAPKAGGYTPRRGQPNPTQLCIHSFGLGWDKNILQRNRSANAVATDRHGFNPIRFLNGIRDMNRPRSAGGRNVGVHHFISRRGDICHMVPWDYQATHAAGYAQRRSIAIELETHVIRDREGRSNRQLSYTEAVPPYTPEQILAVAFLTKKLMAWTPDDRILRFLGVDDEGEARVRRQEPGFFTHHTVSVVLPDGSYKVDAFCEWEFPPGYRKGDPYPNWQTFIGLPRTWDRRIARFHADKPNGALLSNWDTLFDKVRRLRSFNLATEVFDSSVVNRFVALNDLTITTTGPIAAVQSAARVRTVGVIRSQSMTSSTRSGMYQAARGASSTSARTWDAARSRTESVANRAARVPIITGGTCFNYTTGLWENTTTTNTPGPADRAGTQNHPTTDDGAD